MTTPTKADETQFFDELKSTDSKNTRRLDTGEISISSNQKSGEIPSGSTENITFRNKHKNPKIEKLSLKPLESQKTEKEKDSLSAAATQNIEKDKQDNHSSGSADSQDTIKTHNLSTDFSLQISFKVFHKNIVLNHFDDSIQILNPVVPFLDLFTLLKSHFEPNNSNRDSLDWNLEQEEKMAMPIRDVTKLIPEYDGKEKALDSFIKKIDKLWNYIEEFEANDRTQFLLVLQLKLVDKAAEAVQDNNFDDWDSVKADLMEHITPHRNTEKSELKLCAIKQLPNEDVETYAKRIEDALDTLNRSFAPENQNEIIKKENDRKARKTFENGLLESNLRNKAIARGSNTLKEAVDYIIEQELRHSELKPVQSPSFCTYCKRNGHTLAKMNQKIQDLVHLPQKNQLVLNVAKKGTTLTYVNLQRPLLAMLEKIHHRNNNFVLKLLQETLKIQKKIKKRSKLRMYIQKTKFCKMCKGTTHFAIQSPKPKHNLCHFKCPIDR